MRNLRSPSSQLLIVRIAVPEPRLRLQTLPLVNSNALFAERIISFGIATLVEEYPPRRKLKHNVDGKVILPTGAFVPHYIPGRFLQDRIDEWHRRHPRTAIRRFDIVWTMFNTISTSCAAPSPLVSTYSCTQGPAEVRITELEAEIARLRSKRPDVRSPISSRLQPFRTARADHSDSRINSCAAYCTPRSFRCSFQPRRHIFTARSVFYNSVSHCRTRAHFDSSPPFRSDTPPRQLLSRLH